MKKGKEEEIKKITKLSIRDVWRIEEDFTRWLEKNIDSLNEVLGFDVNIISRGEKVGPFKIDLYGEDRGGNKIIIENQFEETDHTHLGQILTYMTNLEANICIWIAEDPVEEHANVIDWLNETTPDNLSFYLIKIEVIRIGKNSPVSPLFTIIRKPTQEKKQIGKEEKEYAERHLVREKFWTQFIAEINKSSQICKNISPTTESWIGISLGMAGVGMNFAVARRYARSEVYINRGDKKENKRIFDLLFKIKREIENNFGEKLDWDRMDENVTSTIKCQRDGLNVFNEEDWSKMNKFMLEKGIKMHKVFRDAVRKIR